MMKIMTKQERSYRGTTLINGKMPSSFLRGYSDQVLQEYNDQTQTNKLPTSSDGAYFTIAPEREPKSSKLSDPLRIRISLYSLDTAIDCTSRMQAFGEYLQKRLKLDRKPTLIKHRYLNESAYAALTLSQNQFSNLFGLEDLQIQHSVVADTPLFHTLDGQILTPSELEPTRLQVVDPFSYPRFIGEALAPMGDLWWGRFNRSMRQLEANMRKLDKGMREYDKGLNTLIDAVTEFGEGLDPRDGKRHNFDPAYDSGRVLPRRQYDSVMRIINVLNKRKSVQNASDGFVSIDAERGKFTLRVNPTDDITAEYINKAQWSYIKYSSSPTGQLDKKPIRLLFKITDGKVANPRLKPVAAAVMAMQVDKDPAAERTELKQAVKKKRALLPTPTKPRLPKRRKLAATGKANELQPAAEAEPAPSSTRRGSWWDFFGLFFKPVEVSDNPFNHVTEFPIVEIANDDVNDETDSASEKLEADGGEPRAKDAPSALKTDPQVSMVPGFKASLSQGANDVEPDKDKQRLKASSAA